MFKLDTIDNQSINDLAEGEFEAGPTLDSFYSVQFILNGKGPSYQFKLRNISPKKTCILVNQDSYVFHKLEVGMTLEVEFNQPGSFVVGQTFETLVTSKYPCDRCAGHSLVELAIIDGYLNF